MALPCSHLQIPSHRQQCKRDRQCLWNVQHRTAFRCHAVRGSMPMYTEKEYLAQQQAHERAEWAANVRSATGKRNHQFWEPQLDPPPLLAEVSVVLISPRRPVSVGTVARAASCFEAGDIRIVQSRCEYNSRHSKSASKGAQYLIYQAQLADTIKEATTDCAARIAFTRWTKGCSLPFYDLASLTSHPAITALITAPIQGQNASNSNTSSHTHADHRNSALCQDNQSAEFRHSNHNGHGNSSIDSAGLDIQGAGQLQKPLRVALVFGREELGMSDEEVAACDAVCSIPIGRLQESLSLSHAVTLALSSIYQQRLAYVSKTSLTSSNGNTGAAYHVTSPSDLATGIDLSIGQER